MRVEAARVPRRGSKRPTRRDHAMSKVKGIPFWEQYLEYIVLGAAVLVFVALTALQFVGNPNAATVGGQVIAPGEIDAFIEAEARRVDAVISGKSGSDIGIPKPRELSERFATAIEEPVIARATLVAAIQRGVDLGSGEVFDPDGVKRYKLPQPLPPTRLQTRQTQDALAQSAIDENESLAAMFTQPPYDVLWTTPSAVFDTADLRRQFNEEGDDFSAIPVKLHENRVYALDVVLEREEYVDGEWVNLAVVDALPGQFTYRSELSGEVMARTRDRMLEELSDSAAQMQIVQPPFFATRNNYWTAPGLNDHDDVQPQADQEQELSEEELRIRSLQRRLDDLQQRRAGLVTQLEERGCDESMKEGPEKPQDPGRGAGGRGGGGTSGRGGGGRGGGGGTPPPGGDAGTSSSGGAGQGRADPTGAPQQKERDRQTCAKLYRQLDEMDLRLEKIRAELEELGVIVQSRLEDVEVIDPLQQDELLIWAHDLDIEPGRTYRYRFIVKIANPFYARGLLLTKDQQHFAENITLDSPASEWSEPIEVQPPLVDFVTRAYGPAGDIGVAGVSDIGHAKLEVFKFEDGRWWNAEFTVKPGDQVGEVREQRSADGAAIDVDFSTEWFVLDVVPDIQADGERLRTGFGALVVLQNLRTGEVSERRDPVREADDPRRDELLNQVDLSRPSPAVASSGG